MSTPLPVKLFDKEVLFAPSFNLKCLALGKDLAELIVTVTATRYPFFVKRKHGLVIGQISDDFPPGHEGPHFQFIYKVLTNKVFFVELKVGGFSEAELKAFEATYDL